MACAATGQLTSREFEQAVRLFVDWWRAVASSGHQLCWSLESAHMPVTDEVVAYAQLEHIVPAGSADKQQHKQLPPAPADELQALQQCDAGLLVHSELDAEEDEAAVSLAAVSFTPASTGPARAAPAAADAAGADVAPAQQQQQHVHQYSIVYHDTYRVAVLYLRAAELDGRPLSLSQLLQDLPALQQYGEASQSDWTFITQVEHPLQRTPCFMLHPCQTAARMQLLLQQQHSTAQAAAAAAVHCAPACQETFLTAHAADNSGGRRRNELPESAAGAAGVRGSGAMQCRGAERGGLSGDALLLLYMRAWFSMVAGLLGIDMLPIYTGTA